MTVPPLSTNDPKVIPTRLDPNPNHSLHLLTMLNRPLHVLYTSVNYVPSDEVLDSSLSALPILLLRHRFIAWLTVLLLGPPPLNG